MLRAGKDARVIYVTVGKLDEAEHIARTLIDEQLAACVNLIPQVRSFYRWEGAVQDDAEILLIIKTIEPHLEALEARVNELHSYDVAEFIALPVTSGSQAYLSWLENSVRERS